MIERTTVVQFSPRKELVKERAEGIVSGKYNVYQVAHGRGGFDLDLETYRCSFCQGAFPKIGWARVFHDDRGVNYLHVGCHKEANNWAERDMPDFDLGEEER